MGEMLHPSASTPRVPVPISSNVLQDAPLLPEMDGLPGIEDQVWTRIADWLWGTSAAYLPIADDESDPEEPTQAAGRCKNTGVSGKLRIADTTMFRHVTWPK